MVRVVFSLAVCLAFSVSASAQERKGKLLLDTWDACYLQGTRCGHVHTYTQEYIQGESHILQTTIELRLKIRRFESEVIDLGMDVGTLENPQGKVLAVFMRQMLGKTKQVEIIGVVEGNQLKLTRDRSTPLPPAPWQDDVLGMHRQQTLFKDKNLKPGDKLRYPSFEPSVNLVVGTHVEAKELEEIELPGKPGKKRLLRVEIKPDRVEKVQLPTLVAWLSPEKEIVRQDVDMPGLGKIVQIRTTKQDALNVGTGASGVEIGFGQLVRLKQRILNPHQTLAGTYRIKINGDDDPVSTFAKDDRQQVRDLKNGWIELTVQADGGKGVETEEPGAEYRESSYFITSDDPLVKDLARRAIGLKKEPRARAILIERWVHDHMKGVDTEQMAPANHVARTLQGDCTEFAMLTAAMCRAADIPARTAVGLIYADVNNVPAFAFHMWTEVWVDGRWLPLDATLGQGSVGACHLKVVDQSWRNIRDLTPLFPVLRVLGRLQIEVVSVRSRERPKN